MALRAQIILPHYYAQDDWVYATVLSSPLILNRPENIFKKIQNYP
jgi:hypothetical protein